MALPEAYNVAMVIRVSNRRTSSWSTNIGLFLGDKDWAQIVKTNHYLLWGSSKREECERSSQGNQRNR
jgi:hypothetical protein